MNKLTENKMNKLILKNIYLVLNDLDTLENIPRPQNLDDYERKARIPIPYRGGMKALK